jgi:hypothetical protein
MNPRPVVLSGILKGSIVSIGPITYITAMRIYESLNGFLNAIVGKGFRSGVRKIACHAKVLRERKLSNGVYIVVKIICDDNIGLHIGISFLFAKIKKGANNHTSFTKIKKKLSVH